MIAQVLLAAALAAGPQPPPWPEPDPLAGRVVVLDAGHQLGNARFPGKVSRPVPAGGFTKPCNTAGTSTDGGYPEATFTWQVARLVRDRLRDLGATVVLTRTSNRPDRWGPCIDERGLAGNRIGADLKVSIHADGSHAHGAHGFHLIAPTSRPVWTADVAEDSLAAARDLRRGLRSAGLPVATYVAGGDGIDLRSDLATLNLSDVPVVVAELGNMRHRSDARRMTSGRGRATYARGLVTGIRERLSQVADRPAENCHNFALGISRTVTETLPSPR